MSLFDSPLVRRWFPFSLLAALPATALVATVFAGELASPKKNLPAVAQASKSMAPTTRVLQEFGRVSLNFAPNQGQAPEGIRFLARGPGYTVGLGQGDATILLKGKTGDAQIRLSLAGSTAKPSIVPEAPLEGRLNYLIGNDHSKWITNVPTWGRIRYQAVYPGIDLAYYGNQQELEHDFILAPGAKPEAIRWKVEGADKLSVASSGDLMLSRNGAEIAFRQPEIYQTSIAGQREKITGQYQLLVDNEIGFSVGQYDHSRELVIDPVLIYSTYLGGTKGDGVRGMAIDASNNVYLTGYTYSTNFPVVGAEQATHGVDSTNSDAFVTKLNSTGNAVIFSTYLGGNKYDDAAGIALDQTSSTICITGTTYSTNFPTALPLQPAYGGGGDAYLAELNSTGAALVFSSYYGGSQNEIGTGVAVGVDGVAAITGYTAGDVPTTNPEQATNGGLTDIFVADYTADRLAYHFATNFGGNSIDEAFDVAIDNADSVYVVGQTSTDLSDTTAFHHTSGFTYEINDKPAANPYDPAILIAKFTSDGGLVGAVTINGKSNAAWDLGRSLAVDNAGNVYVTGETQSTTLPVKRAFQSANAGGSDAFVLKLDSSLLNIDYLTYLGGANDDFGRAIAIDSDGSAYVTGNSDSTDFPTIRPLQTSYYAGYQDAFVTKLVASGDQLIYSTYLGGEGADVGNAITVDANGNAYVGGETYSAKFPLVSNLTVPNGGNPGSSTQASGFVANIQNPNLDLSVTVSKTATPDLDPTSGVEAQVQGNLTQTFSVTNTPISVGEAAQNIVLTVKVPSSLSIVSEQPSATVTATATGSTVVYTLESLAAGATATFNLTTTPLVAGTSEVDASVSNDVFDPNPANNTIKDQTLIADKLPTVTVLTSLDNQVEGINNGSSGNIDGQYTFTRTGSTTQALVVHYTVDPLSTVVVGQRYYPLTDVVTIPAGSLSAVVNVETFDDTAFEGTQTLIVDVSADPAYTVGSPGSATLHILDNDPAPVVSITASTPIGAEPNTPAQFTVTRTSSNGSYTNDLVVNYTVSGTATNGVDYQTLTGVVTIPSGASQATINVNPIDDTIVEPDETVIVTLSTTSLYVLGSSSSATATIQDNDSPVTVSVTATVSGGLENFVAVDTTTGVTYLATGYGQFTFTRTGPTVSPLPIKYTVGGTATPGADYVPMSGNATIPAGSASVDVIYNFLTDFIYEGNETVIATVKPVKKSYKAGSPNSATGIITDDDAPPVITVAATIPNASEPSTAGQFTLTRTVTDSRALDSVLVVSYAISGTATNGVDYVKLTGTATFNSGSDTALVTVTPIDDTITEGDETVNLTLTATSSSLYKLGTNTAATVTIHDNEPPAVSIVATDPTASEPGTDTGTFTVTRAGGTTNALKVYYSIGGTATNGVDYITLPGSVTIPAGSSTATITVTPKADTIKESTETVIATLQVNSAYVVSGSSATVNILDNAPTISLLPTDTDASEPGSNTGTATVSLTVAPTSNLTVYYTIGGTATNGVDYKTLSGYVIIPAGQTSATIVVTPIDDTIKEPTETVILTLKANAAYGISGSSVTVNIKDNDAGL